MRQFLKSYKKENKIIDTIWNRNKLYLNCYEDKYGFLPKFMYHYIGFFFKYTCLVFFWFVLHDM